MVWRLRGRRSRDGDVGGGGAVGGDGGCHTGVAVAGGRLAGLRRRREDSDARQANEPVLPKLGGHAGGVVDGALGRS